MLVYRLRGGGHVAELTEKEIAEIRSVTAAWDRWQERLKRLWYDHYKGVR